MEEEMSSLHKNDTWELIELPKGKNAIGCQWVYAKKHGSQEDTVRCTTRKHRLQRGILPCCNALVIRISLELVAQYELDLDRLDVKAAFLHDDLDEEIYMAQPIGSKLHARRIWYIS